MAILEKEILITVNPMNMKHYGGLNYDVDGNKTGSKILVKIEDVPEGSSSVRVTKICDECGEHIKNVIFANLIKSRKNTDGKDRCKKCARSHGALTRKNNVAYENSFEYYAIKNNLEDLLDHFSSKNNKRPSEISKGNKDEYIWECRVCNSEYEMRLSSKLQSGIICSYCDGRKINTTNCLHVTHPEISKLLKYQKRGYEISKGMHTVEEFVCSNCGNIETKKIDTVVNYGFNCSRCSDAISYPEKFLTSLLQQFEISFEKEKVFEWSKINDEVTNKLINKRYDFYLPDFNIIIETHGGQHFKGGFHTLGGRKLNEEIENDILKESLAEKNGIHKYIVIDCCLSELNYIKNSILNSELVKYININKTNWIKCHEYACNSLVKEACYLWNNCQIISQVAKKLSLCTATITKYLKQGEALGWCNFSNGRKIIQLSNNDDFLKEWDSVSIASKTLGISHISSACSGRRKSAGGYKWMYKENYDKYIENKIISLV